MNDTLKHTKNYGHDDVLIQVSKWRNEGKEVAIATVINTWGSSPRPIGSVSGGCIEGAVVHNAKEVMNDNKPRVLSFGVSDEMAWEVGLACGGKVEVYLERVE